MVGLARRNYVLGGLFQYEKLRLGACCDTSGALSCNINGDWPYLRDPQNAVTYQYKIRASNDDGYSDWSDPSPGSTRLPAPATISATLSGGNAIVSWSAVSWAGTTGGTMAYFVQSLSAGGAWTNEGYTAVGTTTLNVGPPAAGGDWYRVVPVNNAGYGTPSASVEIGAQWLPTNEKSPWDGSDPVDCPSCDAHEQGPGSPQSTAPQGPDPVDLATGDEIYLPSPDISVYNPNGPSVSFQRQYNTSLATSETGSPGLGVGWAHNYDYSILSTPGSWSSADLVYPNGATNVLTPVLSGGSPTGAFTAQTGAPYVVAGVASGTTGVWTSITMTLKDRSKYEFTALGSAGTYALSQITNGLGQSITLNWSSSRDLTSIVDNTTSSTLLSLSYSSGFLQSITDATGSTSRSVYYTNGALSGFGSNVLTAVSQIVATGTSSPPARASYGYSALSVNSGPAAPFLTTSTVPNPSGTGNSTATINYNSSGQVSSLVDANGNQQIYGYGYTNGSYNATVVQTENSSNALAYQYTQNFDSANRNAGSTDYAGESNTIGYGDSSNPSRPTTITDEDSLQYQYTYDSFGNMLTSKTPQGTTTTYTVSTANFALGEVTKIVKGSKTETDFTYNEPSGLLHQVSAPIPGQSGSGSTQTSTFYYTTIGNVSEILTPGNNSVTSHETTFGYTTDGTYTQSEALGEPIVVTDSNSHSVHLRYDSYGNLASKTDALGNEYQYFYNLANQQTEIENPATDQTGTGNSYTINGYLYPGGPLENVKLYDESGALSRTETYGYGNEGELLSKDGDELSVGYTYDAKYHVTGITNGLSKTTGYVYNLLGELTTVDYPDSTSITYGNYDNAHKLGKRVDQKGVETNYTYASADGLLSKITYPSTSVTFTYDAYDRVTGVSDTGSGTYGYSFDDLDEQTGAQTTYTGQSEVDLGYSYYPDGSLETETIPGSETFQYSYDAGGRATSLVNPNSETTTWNYQNNDWLSAQTDNNGNYVHYIHNALGQLSEIANYNPSASVVSEIYSITHDAAGNITDEHISVPGYTSLAGEITNTYDSLDQIATSVSTRTATGMGYSWTPAANGFEADAAGNLTTLRDQTQTYTSTNNEINKTGFAYDANGNPTTYETHSVSWDPENRMTEYDGSTTLTCGWRPDGMRAWKNSSSTTTYFYYDLLGHPVLEYRSGSLYEINTFGPNGLISRGTISTNETYYQFDERGNTITRSNSSATILGYHGSDTYGVQFASESSTDPFLGFGAQWGYYRDTEISFLLLGHRIYDPGYARFLNRDPIGYVGGINGYDYAWNNPPNRVDPLGLRPRFFIIIGNVHGIEQPMTELAAALYDYYQGDYDVKVKFANYPGDVDKYLSYGQAGALLGHGADFSCRRARKTFGQSDLGDIAKKRKALGEPPLDVLLVYSCSIFGDGTEVAPYSAITAALFGFKASCYPAKSAQDLFGAGGEWFKTAPPPPSLAGSRSPTRYP